MEWIECTDPSNDLQWKQVDVWMGNRYTNGDAMRGDDDQQFTKTIQTMDNGLNKVVFTFNCADYLLADPKASSPMLVVNAATTVQVGSSVSETVLSTLASSTSKKLLCALARSFAMPEARLMANSALLK